MCDLTNLFEVWLNPVFGCTRVVDREASLVVNNYPSSAWLLWCTLSHDNIKKTKSLGTIPIYSRVVGSFSSSTPGTLLLLASSTSTTVCSTHVYTGTRYGPLLNTENLFSFGIRTPTIRERSQGLYPDSALSSRRVVRIGKVLEPFRRTEVLFSSRQSNNNSARAMKSRTLFESRFSSSKRRRLSAVLPLLQFSSERPPCPPPPTSAP